MRGMRACATANLVFLGLFCATLGFAACSTGSTPPQAPAASDAVPTGAAPPANTAPLFAADVPKGKPAPQTAADCKVLVSEITNEPPAGAVALNNAQVAKDAGATDRLEPLTELVRSKRDAFRCCFDIWAKDHAGAQGSVKLVLKLKADGSVISVDFEDGPNRVSAPEVEGCISDLAKSLPYPPSPSGKETKFRYPFDFKARK
jgi:hypothetical protein